MASIVIIIGFAIFASVSLTPTTFVSIPGGSASFFCLSAGSDVVGIEWKLDDKPLSATTNITDVFINDHGFGTLQFSELADVQNRTSIRCKVEFRSTQSLESNTAMLVLQGLKYS